MAIEALGVRPQITTSPAQQSKEIATPQEAQVGNVNVMPEAEKTSGQGAAGHEEQGQSQLGQMLNSFEKSTQDKVAEIREQSEISELSNEEVKAAELQFKEDLAAIHEKVSSSSTTEAGFVSNGMLDAITKLASSLQFSIEGILPPVPPSGWEATYPPEPKLSGDAQFPQDAMFHGLDKLA